MQYVDLPRTSPMWEQMTRGDFVFENYEQFLTAPPSILVTDCKSLDDAVHVKGMYPACTSYSRTFGYGKLRTSTWSTLRTMARTPQSTLTCTMRSSEHAAHRLLMHSVHTSHLWLKVSPCVSFHVIHACALVSCFLSGLSSPVSLLPRPVLLPALPDVHLGA